MPDYRILVVEDNDDHAELLMMALAGQSIPCHVDRVPTGEEALTYLQQEREQADHARTDLVLLDVNLPGQSGLEVLKAIKSAEDSSGLPVVIVTTSDAARDRNEAYKNHANSYIVKPMGFHELQKVCEALIAYWGVFNCRPETH